MRYLAALVSFFALIALNFAEAAPKELEPLQRYLGGWEATREGHRERWVGQGEWLPGHQFVRVTWTLDVLPGQGLIRSGTTIKGFDAKKGVYRLWEFTSEGYTNTGEGVWDEAAHAFTWTLKDARNGDTRVVKSTFGDDGTESEEQTTTSSAGKVSTLRMKNTRRTVAGEFPAVLIEKLGGFAVTDGSSWYSFAKGGKFTSGPMGMSGRQMDGTWTLAKNSNSLFTVQAHLSWINGLSPRDEYRRIVFVINYPTKSATPATAPWLETEIFDAYWYIDELVKIPKPE